MKNYKKWHQTATCLIFVNSSTKDKFWNTFLSHNMSFCLKYFSHFFKQEQKISLSILCFEMKTKHKKSFFKVEIGKIKLILTIKNLWEKEPPFIFSPQTLSVASVKHIRDGQQYALLHLSICKKVTFLFTPKPALPPPPGSLVETNHWGG